MQVDVVPADIVLRTEHAVAAGVQVIGAVVAGGGFGVVALRSRQTGLGGEVWMRQPDAVPGLMQQCRLGVHGIARDVVGGAKQQIARRR